MVAIPSLGSRAGFLIKGIHKASYMGLEKVTTADGINP